MGAFIDTGPFFSVTLTFTIATLYIMTFLLLLQLFKLDTRCLLLAGWGSHYDDTQVPYLTAAAAIGMTRQDIELFIKRLDKVLAVRSKEVAKRQQEMMVKQAHMNSKIPPRPKSAGAAAATTTQV